MNFYMKLTNMCAVTIYQNTSLQVGFMLSKKYKNLIRERIKRMREEGQTQKQQPQGKDDKERKERKNEVNVNTRICPLKET